jgi:hypothetical protein
MARCRSEEPKTQEVLPGHFVACHLHEAGRPGVLGVPASVGA